VPSTNFLKILRWMPASDLTVVFASLLIFDRLAFQHLEMRIREPILAAFSLCRVKVRYGGQSTILARLVDPGSGQGYRWLTRNL